MIEKSSIVRVSAPVLLAMLLLWSAQAEQAPWWRQYTTVVSRPNMNVAYLDTINAGVMRSAGYHGGWPTVVVQEVCPGR